MANTTTRNRATRKAPAKTAAKTAKTPAKESPERSTRRGDRRSDRPAATPDTRPAVRFHHDGQPMPDSQNRLSSLAWGFTRGLDGERPRISVTELRKLLADAGVPDPKSAPWSVKLANGITIAAKVERPAKANGAKPAKATTRKRSTT
jgi:hypothetical protein